MRAVSCPVGSFNPRSRKGNDCKLLHGYLLFVVSIHVPARGTTSIAATLRLTVLFQSTFPQGERHSGVSFPLISYLFQSTFPQGERLQVVGSGGQLNSVSIHVPARGTTLDDGDVLVIDTVSIHVPARGTT